MSKFGMVLLCWVLLLVACSEQVSEAEQELGRYENDQILYNQEEVVDPPKTSEPPPPPSTSAQTKVNRIIKNGHMEFEVTGLELAKSNVDSLLRVQNGYYENEQYQSYGNRISYSLTIRIPAARFDTLIYALEQGFGNLKSKDISAQDVTEEYIDLNIRLNNNLAYLKRYKEILARAKTVEEILEVQERIRRIEEEIESKKGRLKFLDDQVNFSTLHLELTELVAASLNHEPSFGRRLANAFNNGIEVFLNFVVGLVNLWPFLLLFSFLFWIRKPLMSRIRSVKTSKKEP